MSTIKHISPDDIEVALPEGAYYVEIVDDDDNETSELGFYTKDKKTGTRYHWIELDYGAWQIVSQQGNVVRLQRINN